MKYNVTLDVYVQQKSMEHISMHILLPKWGPVQYKDAVLPV